jgi:hypothetical protein
MWSRCLSDRAWLRPDETVCRLKMVASMAKCLLRQRSLQFSLPRSSLRGSEGLVSFAILFRELPVDRHEELIRRAMRWPDPMADQRFN